ncbi:MAG: sugar transporter substrate-binding protein [Modestobacter sp.]|jgi:protein TorT|nr:sugar transporter substrate-binding protein [Modestobacter sp.]
MTRRNSLLGAGTLGMLTLITACGGGSSADSGVRAQDEGVWSIDATFIDCDAAGVDPAGCVGPGEQGTYTALAADKVTKPWNICITVPHLKDPIWVASNYGGIAESRRLGIEAQFHDAGGYENVTTQASQIEDCATQGVDAIIVGAVSQDALNPVIQSAVDKGIVVIDAGNGVTSTAVQGRAIVDYYQMGHAVGEQLAGRKEPLRVALLPGPAGAGWAERSVVGFKEAIAGSQVELVDTKYGDTDREVQLGLVEDTLSTHDDLDAIVGTAVTVDVASGVVTERGLNDLDLYGTYLNPTTLDLLSASKATCAPTEQPVNTFKMAVEMAVRLLQDEPVKAGFERSGPEPLMVCGPLAGDANNVADFDMTTSFAPDGWDPVTTVAAPAN